MVKIPFPRLLEPLKFCGLQLKTSLTGFGHFWQTSVAYTWHAGKLCLQSIAALWKHEIWEQVPHSFILEAMRTQPECHGNVHKCLFAAHVSSLAKTNNPMRKKQRYKKGGRAYVAVSLSAKTGREHRLGTLLEVEGESVSIDSEALLWVEW